MIQNILNFATLLLGLVSIVLVTGIVWRVEKRLDISYKFFQIAIVVFSGRIVFEILHSFGIVPFWYWREIIDLLFVLLFLIGLFEMRVLIRHIDGEDHDSA